MLRTLLTLQIQIKLHHWQTLRYSRHKATDDLFEKLIPLTDRFVETFQGARDTTIMLNKTIESKNMSEDEITTFLKDIRNDLKRWKLQEPELDNIVQEMLEAINVTIYLFSLD